MKKVSKIVLFSAGLLLAGSVLAGDLKVKFNVATGAQRAWEAQNKGRLILQRRGEPTMFKPKPGYSVVGDTEAKESVSLSLYGAGSYKIMWNVTGKDPQEVGAFEYTGEGDQDITITYDGAGVSVTDFGSLRPVMKEDAVTALPPAGLTAAQIRQQEFAASRAEGGAAARVAAEEAASKKAQEEQAREEARKRLEEQERAIERQRAAEEERAAQLKADEARAAAEEQARKDEEAASMNGAATKIQSKARQRAATKQVSAMKAEKERVAAQLKAEREAAATTIQSKVRQRAATKQVQSMRAEKTAAAAGAGSGGTSAARAETHFSVVFFFKESAQEYSNSEFSAGHSIGTVRYTTMTGEEKTLPIKAATVDVTDLDRIKPLWIKMEGHDSEAKAMMIQPDDTALHLTLQTGAASPLVIDTLNPIDGTPATGAGAGSGGTEPQAYVAPLYLEFGDSDLATRLVDKMTLTGTVSFKTVDGKAQTLPLNAYTLILDNIDRTQPVTVEIKGVTPQSITVKPGAWELRISIAKGELVLQDN